MEANGSRGGANKAKQTEERTFPTKTKGVAGRLVPVELAAKKPPTQHESNCGLAVVLPGGRRIEVHPDFDTNTFARLVSVLERE